MKQRLSKGRAAPNPEAVVSTVKTYGVLEDRLLTGRLPEELRLSLVDDLVPAPAV